MLRLAVAELPTGIVLLLACYIVVQHALGAKHQPVTILLGLLLGFAATGVTALLDVWLGLGTLGSVTLLEAIGLGLAVALPSVALNAILILLRAAPLDARDAGSAAGCGFALANVVLFAIGGMQVNLVTFTEVLRALPFLLLSLLMAYAVSLLLAVGRDRHRLATSAILALLLLTLNLTTDRLLLFRLDAFAVYEAVALLLAAGIIVLVVRLYRGTRPSARPARTVF